MEKKEMKALAPSASMKIKIVAPLSKSDE